MKKFFTIVAAMLLCSIMAAPSLVAVTTADGALEGRFTVNALGDQVVFSQGNLQYNASSQTWQFATEQYAMVGGTNENVAADYDGWIDLFGYGTGGNPTLASNNVGDYLNFSDWGANAISNGGNEANMWRTLSTSEWIYLLRSRQNAAKLFALGSVNGVCGLILLPDDWSAPSGVSIVANTDNGLSWNGVYFYGEGQFALNSFSAEQWALLEQAGAVFLPATGNRLMTCVSGVGLQGCYWTATGGAAEQARALNFASYTLNPQSDLTRENALAVRLVKQYEQEQQWLLRGDFNEWNETLVFAPKAGGESGILYATASDLEAGVTYKFKIYTDKEGGIWYGNNGTMGQQDHAGWVFEQSAGDCRLAVSVAGDYEFSLDPATLTVSVVYPSSEGQQTATDWWLKGDFNDWAGDNFKTRQNGAENTVYATVTLPAGKELEFKINNGDAWYSNDGTMTQLHREAWVFSATVSTNCKLVTTIKGDYEFAFNTSDNTLTITYPVNSKQARLYESPVRSNNPDVMLQAFYWAHEGNTSTPYTAFGDVNWSTLADEAADLAQYFDMVWLAPSQETADYTGYLPMNYSNQGQYVEAEGHHGHSPWGTGADLRRLIDNLHRGGAKVIADIVLNHTCAGHVDEYTGSDKNWCTWTENDFGRYGKFTPDYSWITAEDEMFADDYMAGRIDRTQTGDCGNHSTATLTPDDKVVSMGSGTFDWAYSEYNSIYSRDLAHGKKEVREMSRAYLTWMRDSIGYDGFRFDFMKGIAGKYLLDYNRTAAPYFSVAEVFDGDIDKQLGYLKDVNYQTYMFDFPGKFTIYNSAIREYKLQNLKGNQYTMIFGNNKKYAVSFIDNHDSFHEGSSLYGTANTLDDRQAQMALAYLLSMPGVPCVAFPYWNNYPAECKAFIKARRSAGVHSESEVVNDWAGDGSVGNNYYTALIQGTKGYLFLKLGYDSAPTDAPMVASPDGNEWKLAWANEHTGVWYTGEDWEYQLPTQTVNVKQETPVTKFMQDGVLYIQRGNELYNAQGARVK